MKAGLIQTRTGQWRREQAASRIGLIALCAALILAGLIALRYHTASRRPVQPAAAPADSVLLSDSTRAVLEHLESPVSIHFYSILDPATVQPPLIAYAGRVDELLGGFERQGNGKITVTRYTAISDSAANSAAADGIKPFNLEKGNACYLGISVACGDQRENLADLSPEWEQALEFDLSRVIERVSRPRPAPKVSAGAARAETAARQDVLRAIPNVANVSLEEGTRILRDAAMKQYQAAVEEMGKQVKEAEQQIIQARQSGSEADQAAALKRLQQVQSDQSDKIKQIAASLDAQLDVLKQLKSK